MAKTKRNRQDETPSLEKRAKQRAREGERVTPSVSLLYVGRLDRCLFTILSPVGKSKMVINKILRPVIYAGKFK